MNIAIIPARGGSKRIPKKNIKNFFGHPIISYSIKSALESKLFDEVMVSTDDVQIADIAREYGATVPFMRNKETSGDYATTADVILEVLGVYQKRGKKPDNVCCLYPTAPFVTAQKLHDAMEMFLKSAADALVPVVPFSYPPQRGLILVGNQLKMKWPENINARSQDLEPLYHDCGQFYILKSKALREERKIFMNNTIPFVVSELEMQDIDNEDDWEIAEIKYQKMVKDESR